MIWHGFLRVSETTTAMVVRRQYMRPFTNTKSKTILDGLMAVARNHRPWLYWIRGRWLVSLNPGKPLDSFKLELPMFDDEVSRSTWTYTTSRIVVNGKPKPEWLIRIRAVQYQAEVLDWNHN